MSFVHQKAPKIFCHCGYLGESSIAGFGVVNNRHGSTWYFTLVCARCQHEYSNRQYLSRASNIIKLGVIHKPSFHTTRMGVVY